MPKFEKVISKYCPNIVTYKKLQDILSIKNGSDYKKFKSGNIPVYGSGGIIHYIDKYAYNKPSVLIPRKGSIDKLYYVDTPFWNVDTIFYTDINTEIAIPKYIFYCLQKEHLEQYNTAGGVPSLTQKVLNQLVIPVPPLPVQAEIVRILDNFTELTAELTARKKQYEYYRNKLLNFNDMVKYKTLGEICYLSAGGDVPKNNFSKTYNDDFQIPIYSNGIGDNALYGYTNIAKINERCVTIAARGTIGYCVLRTTPFFPIIRLICAIPKNEVIADYLKYVIETIKFQVPTSGIPQLTVPMVAKYKIPVPPLKEQEQIVSILDRFNKLCNDISEGLPAEIAARQKQYEFYRDKLLTFKELTKEK